MNGINVVIDIHHPTEVFHSFFRECLPEVFDNQYLRIMTELTTQALQDMQLPESEYLFNLIEKPNYEYFKDIDALFIFENVRHKLSELFKEYAMYLFIEVNKAKFQYNLVNIKDYLLVAVNNSTAVITFVQEDMYV